MTFLIGDVAGAGHKYGDALLITLSLLSNQTTYHHYLNYRSSELNVIKHYFQSRISAVRFSAALSVWFYWFQLDTLLNVQSV